MTQHFLVGEIRIALRVMHDTIFEGTQLLERVGVYIGFFEFGEIASREEASTGGTTRATGGQKVVFRQELTLQFDIDDTLFTEEVPTVHACSNVLCFTTLRILLLKNGDSKAHLAYYVVHLLCKVLNLNDLIIINLTQLNLIALSKSSLEALCSFTSLMALSIAFRQSHI
ncbi:hypothetical protein FGO68_gene6375 [Halteria grandinella]|uniref:Uncharacterized protein n=1 Tax=Halteria grandinella TaxID=5974 RepID=A0A8J8NM63_HALGN|nr:hypothetical protein FGO68_gene6375 [Halteria grandinella]